MYVPYNNSNPWIVSHNQKDLISLKLQFYYDIAEIYIYLIYSKSVLKYAFEKETFQIPIKTYPCLQFLGTSRK